MEGLFWRLKKGFAYEIGEWSERWPEAHTFGEATFPLGEMDA